MSRISQRNKRKNKKKTKKRKSNNSGSNDNKRQRFSGYASEIIESEESEALPEISAGETKESDSDRRGREKKEREQKKTEDAAERKRQGDAKRAANQTKLITANIGGKRVTKNGIITFEGGETFGPFSSKQAEEATGILKPTIRTNIHRKNKSSGKKGVFENKQVMFINEPVDTSDKFHCIVPGCNNHFSYERHMIAHVRAKHPGVLPPAREIIIKPETFTFMTQEQYAFAVTKVRSNIENDIDKGDLPPKLMALVDGFAEPLVSHNIEGAAKKYHFTEQQILDSIANNEPLTIYDGSHRVINGLGRKVHNLAGRKVTFSWKYRVTEEDKIKLKEMNNNETHHMLARQICEHMNVKGMFASENVIDDNGGLLKNGFVFRYHGGLFNLSFDRIDDNYTVNGQTFRKLHYTNLENALENIRTVALMANVPYKASIIKIQDRYDVYKNKSVEQRQKEFEEVLKFSKKTSHNGKSTPLYAHAKNTWKKKDKQCQSAFPDGFKAYWQHMLVLLEKQEGLCAVAKIPMLLESGPWLMSCDAIDPLLGHVPGNLRLVCLYNNVIDFSKENKDLTDPTPHSLNTVLHDEYWRIVRPPVLNL